MNIKKTFLVSVLVSTCLFGTMALVAHAQVNGNGTPPGVGGVNGNGLPPASTVTTLQNPLKGGNSGSIGQLINNLLDIFAYIVVLFAVLAIIWVGFQFILARGEPNRLVELKNWLLYIVIGVAIVIGARLIISVVISTLEASGTLSQDVTKSARNAIQAK